MLIVTGGSLAALPFRKYQSSVPETSGPVQATGPTERSLQQTKIEFLAQEQSSPDQTAPPAEFGKHPLPPWQAEPVVQTRRRLPDQPLTYEDLAVPIAQPEHLRERFSASVAQQEQRQAQHRATGLVMPEMESLALSERNQIEAMSIARQPTAQQRTVVQPDAQQNDYRAALVSTPVPGSQTEPLPAPSVVSVTPEPIAQPRPKHWIRQP